MPSLRIANIAFPIRDGKVSVQTICRVATASPSR